MKKSVFLIGLLLLFLVGALILAGQKNVGKTETIFSLSFTDYQGKTVKLSDLENKPLVINSWAAWCPFCRKELQDFVTIQQELKDQVVFIAIDRGEPLTTAKKYTDELGVTNNLVLFLDPTDSFYQAIGGFSMPETIFIDKEGVIRDHKRGPMEIPEIRERIQKIL